VCLLDHDDWGSGPRLVDGGGDDGQHGRIDLGTVGDAGAVGHDRGRGL